MGKVYILCTFCKVSCWANFHGSLPQSDCAHVMTHSSTQLAPLTMFTFWHVSTSHSHCYVFSSSILLSLLTKTLFFPINSHCTTNSGVEQSCDLPQQGKKMNWCTMGFMIRIINHRATCDRLEGASWMWIRPLLQWD